MEGNKTMIDLNRANKLMTDIEVLDRFAEIFKTRIKDDSWLEILDSIDKDFMNALAVVGYIIGQDSDYVKGYLKASFRQGGRIK
jgi:hypothetical protein